MQQTRQHILDILNEHGQATVPEITQALCDLREDTITAVTVRHHLNQLEKQNVIQRDQPRRQNKPGRPQQVYTLTDAAQEYLPSNYQQLTSHLIRQIRQHLPPPQVNVMMQDMASQMASEVGNINHLSGQQRITRVVEYLNQQGYKATWEQSDEGYVLHTSNCPYHTLAQEDDALCNMDLHMIATLMGCVPRRLSLISCGADSCSYLFPHELLSSSST